MNPLISIITPNYNYDQYIGQTIESIISQDYDNIEYIIVDDGSTDNSVEVIQMYVAKYPKQVKLIKQTNHGQTYSINTGLRQASGDIVGWINSDDTYCKGAFKEVIKVFNENKDVDIVFGDLIMIDSMGGEIKKRKQLPVDKFTGTFLGFGGLVASNTVFWRAELMKRVGYLNSEFVFNMDGEYFSRLFVDAKSIHIDKNIASFRVHSEAKSSSPDPEKRRRYLIELDCELRRSYHNLFISKFVPYKYTYPFKLYCKIKRFNLKTFNNFKEIIG